MKKTDINKELRFQPDTELLEFATWFASNHKKLPVGLYHSRGSKYSIRYLDGIKDDRGRLHTTFSRVSHLTEIIDISRLAFKNKKLTEHFMFYSIIWNIVKLKLTVEWGIASDLIADEVTMRYYIEAQVHRPRKDIIIGWILQLEKAADSNFLSLKNRIKAMKKQVLKAQKEDERHWKKFAKGGKKFPLNNEIKSRTFKTNSRKGNRKRKK